MTLEVRCPAKVNLFLSVGPPGQTGYHPIRTVFQAVGLYDRLTISDGVLDDAFEWDMPIPLEDNSVLKALSMVRELVEVPPLSIRLEKQIPIQRGLGGGSSDAAGLLRAIGSFAINPIPAGGLYEVARAVGADVPFFLVGGLAKAEGYGELLEPLPDAGTDWLLLAGPKTGCSTVEAYRHLDSIHREWRGFPAGDVLYNDFERVAPQACLELREKLLALGATGALLCGSGSGVFGRFPSEDAAWDAAQKLDGEKSPFHRVVPTISREACFQVQAVPPPTGPLPAKSGSKGARRSRKP